MSRRSLSETLFRPLGDVRAGEGLRALIMLLGLLTVMVAYYVLKTVREPLILATGGAEVKIYAAGLQAVVLTGFVPAYGWLTRHVGRRGLIIGVTSFFFVCLQLFSLALQLHVPGIGVAFFVWVGIFSVSIIAQFWSLANDLYSQEAGERLFPVIALGATLGSPLGAWIAKWLFKYGVAPQNMLELASLLLVVHGGITLALFARLGNKQADKAKEAPIREGAGGFRLIARSAYLRWVVVMLVLLNIVNTIGEYVLSKNVLNAAELAVTSGLAVSKAAFIGGYYGSFFFLVNVVAAILQALVVSRLVRYFGVRGVLLFLPVVALGVYGALAAGAGFVALRWLKTAEDATNYSVMNTARAMLWLPTSREEKYRAKQAVDTFFVRLGDLIAAGLVAGAVALRLGLNKLSLGNAVLAAIWIFTAWRVANHNNSLSKLVAAAAAQPPTAPRPETKMAAA